jgi:two-component system sensor histidine kinase HydH
MTENLRRTLVDVVQRESFAAVEKFASALAHEVRNPLSAIRLDLQRVEETLETESWARATQQRALREVEQLERAVSSALRIARSGSVTRHRINLLDPIRAAAEAAAPEFAARGAHLDPLAAEPCDVPVLGDSTALTQAFLNLLLNAAQALEPGGRARIEVGVAAGEVTVTVQDDGTGISAEHLTRVFELFFSTRSRGSGLGLPVARQIVMAHEGRIGIESGAGRGTTVRLTLPSAPAVLESA